MNEKEIRLRTKELEGNEDINRLILTILWSTKSNRKNIVKSVRAILRILICFENKKVIKILKK